MAVRREAVRLELEDAGFSTGMAKNALATAHLNRELHNLDGSAVQASRGVSGLGTETDRTGAALRRNSADIDRFSGRLRVLAELGLTVGPALVPLGGAGVAAVAGLTAQLGALAGGAGIAIAALNGVGDALGAVNDYQLDPTADNLAKVAEEFERIGPAAAEFVLYLESISPQLRELQMTAREGFLPGLEKGIDGLLTRGPQVNRIVQEMATALGDLSEAGGESLGGERFDAFFDCIDRVGGTTLMELGRSIGFITEGLANLMVAFSPVSSAFSAGMEGMARSFAEWTRSLDDNESFQEFISYLQTNGPAAVDFLGSFVQALSSVIEAAAPVGQAVLPILTALLDVFAAIAGTPIGTAVLGAAAAFVAFNRAASVLGPAVGRIGDALFLTDRAFTDAGRSAEAARGAFLRAAGTAGVWVVALQGVAEIISGIDTLNRSLDTSSASMGSLAEVSTALTNSNLGKYAADLGIDMQRLSADFAENGRQGEYVNEVLAALGDESGGTMTRLIDAAGIGQEVLGTFGVQLGKQSGEATAAGKALLDLLDRYEETGEAAKGAGAAQEELAASTEYATANLGRLKERLAAARTELKESRQSAREVAQTFVGLGESLNNNKKSLGDWLRELEKNAEALRQFQANAERAGRRGLDEGLVESLRNAGSEGALRMRQLANATDAEIERANSAWRKGQGAVKDFVNEVGGVKPKYVTRLEAQVEQAMADLARLRAQLNIPDEYVNVWVTKRTVNGGGMGPQEPYADGGYTGPGGKYEPAGIVHRGEVVIPQELVKRDWPMLKSRYGHLPGFADGGVVGGSERGIGPNNPLFGIGRDFLSGSELGVRLSNLTLMQLAQVGRDLERLGKGPLAKLSKAFEKAGDLAEKELEASKRKLEALKDERDSIAATVEERLKSTDLFGQINRPGGFDFASNTEGLTPEQIAANVAAQNSVNASLGFNVARSPVDILRDDLARAREERRMIQELESRGLSGAALQYAIESEGGLAGALDLSKRELRQFERLYDRRDMVASNVGDAAGNAVLGDEIRQQTREVRAQREITQAIRQEARDTNRRLERLERLAERAPKDTGREVGDAVNGAASSGQRRRTNG